LKHIFIEKFWQAIHTWNRGLEAVGITEDNWTSKDVSQEDVTKIQEMKCQALMQVFLSVVSHLEH